MHNNIRSALSISLLFFQQINSSQHRWAWLYPIDLKTAKKVMREKEIIIERNHIPLFSQLIIGFNGMRPKKDNFAFFVSAHNPKTNRWGKWHKMMDWGPTLQRSYTSCSDGHTHCAHVRLETEKDNYADGF